MPNKDEVKSDIVKKHEAVINAMSEAEKTEAIVEQLESVEVNVKKKAFYLAKNAALAQQKAAGILSVEMARNKAQSDMEKLQQAWKDAEETETFELPT